MVVGWATGRTAVRANEVLASALRQIYLQVSEHWRVRWSHACEGSMGHSGHAWNDVADALAARGCSGEAEGFACGMPHTPPSADPPPMIAPVARYIWHTVRAVQVSATPEGVVVSSSFVNRHRIAPGDIELVTPGMFLHLRCPPTGDPAADLLAAVRRISSARVDAEEVCHLRPQAIVFQAAGMDWDSARDWVEGLVRVGIGQPVEELRMPREAGEWAQRVACVRCMRQAVVPSDVVEASGWVPPWERVDGGQDPGEVEGEGVEKTVNGSGAPGEATVEEVVSECSEWGHRDDGAGVGVWPFPFGTGVLSLDASGGLQYIMYEPRPPTPIRGFGERGGGGPVVFWPCRVALPAPVPAPTPTQSAQAPGDAARVDSPQPPHSGVTHTFAGWDDQGRELTSVPFPSYVVRPVPLRPCAAPLLSPPPSLCALPPSRLPPAPGVAERLDSDEMHDSEMRHVRSLAARGATEAGMASRCVRTLRSTCRWFASEASRLLALPLPLSLYWARRGDPHEPPD